MSRARIDVYRIQEQVRLHRMGHYYNRLRPHQGLDGQIPARVGEAEDEDEEDEDDEAGDRIVVRPLLGGLVNYHVRVRDEHRLAA